MLADATEKGDVEAWKAELSALLRAHGDGRDANSFPPDQIARAIEWGCTPTEFLSINPPMGLIVEEPDRPFRSLPFGWSAVGAILGMLVAYVFRGPDYARLDILQWLTRGWVEPVSRDALILYGLVGLLGGTLFGFVLNGRRD